MNRSTFWVEDVSVVVVGGEVVVVVVVVVGLEDHTHTQTQDW